MSKAKVWPDDLRRQYLSYEYRWKFSIGSILVAIGVVHMFVVHWLPGLSLCGLGVGVIRSANRSSRSESIKIDPFK